MKKRIVTVLMVLAFVLFSSLAFAQSRGGGHFGSGGRSGGHFSGVASSHFSAWHGGWSRGHGSSWGFRFYAYPGWGWPYPSAYPYYYSYPYSYPYPYYSPPPVVRQEAPVYSEPQQEQPYYWYYCENPQGYYPYVKSCPGGWMKVVPDVTPPEQERRR
jgi:hypothetical protein